MPPYLAPEPRKLVGISEIRGLDWIYWTAGQYREEGLPDADLTLIYGGVTVPGNYLRGRPLSTNEAEQIIRKRRHLIVGGPLANQLSESTGLQRVQKDLAVYFNSYLDGQPDDRYPQPGEIEAWLQAGAPIAAAHPLPADQLLAEVSCYHGCVRYLTGGCSFCSEPLYGKPQFRRPTAVAEEVKALYQAGLRHFRLGGQSCIISYGCHGLGESETPRPNPEAHQRLFSSIWADCPQIRVLHVDNANPAVIAAHPRPARKIVKLLKKYTTAGNTLAFGLESADPRVIEANNLNARPDQVFKAVELVNKIGRERGENGLPALLPGLNFLAGLHEETTETYRLNFEFLKKIVEAGHWLRRINIRQVLSGRSQFKMRHGKAFKKFKRRVREQIDKPLLKEMFPRGLVLKDVLMEKREGNTTFGRQLGTYPILVGVRYPLELDRFYDLRVTEYGYRSLTAVEADLKFEELGTRELQAIPGIGKRRASKLFVNQPASSAAFRELINDPEAAELALRYINFD